MEFIYRKAYEVGLLGYFEEFCCMFREFLASFLLLVEIVGSVSGQRVRFLKLT